MKRKEGVTIAINDHVKQGKWW